MFGSLLAKIALVLLPIALFLVSQTLYIVDERDQVIVTQVGQYLYSVREPGVYAKIPFYHSVNRFEKRILVSDANPAEYLTLDKKRLVADHIARWRIVDPLEFYKAVGTENGARARLDDIVYSQIRAELANNNFDQIISTQREPIMERVSQRTADAARGFGIEVVDVRLKQADLPSEVQASVFARMVAELSRIASRYRSEGAEFAAQIRAEADKERTVILAQAYQESQTRRGEGDAEATAIYARSFGQDPEFYAFLRSLEAYRDAFEEDSGVLVLDPESEFFRYFRDAGVDRRAE